MSKDCVCGSGKPSCAYHCGSYKNYSKCWVNECPFCGGTLQKNPKGTYEGEWTCSKCRADFCMVCGREKMVPSRKRLTACPSGNTKSLKATADGTDSSTTTTPLPVLSGNDVPVSSLITRDVTFKDLKNILTPAEINDPLFYVNFNPNRNTGDFPGKMFVDFIKVQVDYTDPTYSLQATIDNKVLIGNQFTYRLVLKNTNKTHQGVPIPVKVNIPNSFDFVSSDGKFNPHTGIWTASLSKSGIASIYIAFRPNVNADNYPSLDQEITAQVVGFNTSISKTINILAETLKGNITGPTHAIQGKNITRIITVTNNSTITGPGNEDIYIDIPEGFVYHSSTGNGTYDPETSMWHIQFVNKKAVLKLTMNALTPGTYTQTLSSMTMFQEDTLTIIESTITECNFSEIYLPNDILPYLITGQTYILSCNENIITENIGDIYDGFNNFCISSIVDGVETIGTRPTQYNVSKRVSVPFVYDPTKLIKFRLYGQYLELSPEQFEIVYRKWSISSDTDKYEFAGALPDDPNLILQDGEYTKIDLGAGESSEILTLSDINLSGLESDPQLIVKGLGVGIDYNTDVTVTLNVTIISNGQSATRSIILDPTQNAVQLGEKGDDWDLNNMDLTNVELQFSIDNTSLSPTTVQLKNKQFILFWKYDETNGNLGFTLDGVHSRNKDIFLIDDTEKDEGIVPTITTYDVSQSQGELISQFDLKSKTFKLKFKIWGEDLEDAQNRLTEAVKYLTNDKDDLGLPIPKAMIFDWDPERQFNVVLSGEVKPTLDTFVYTVEANFTIPEGCGFSGIKTTGAIGSNDGLVRVRPVINVLCDGSSKVQIFDNVSSQSLIINHEFESGTVLVIDCDDRIVKDNEGHDFTTNVTVNSTWPVLNEDYDFSNSSGCMIQSVEYKEGS